MLLPFTILVAGLACTQDETGWTPLDGERAQHPARYVRERGYGWLRVENDRLVRGRGGEQHPLGCTDPAGTGALRAIAGDPAGLVFVAAERGLFVLSPEVDVLHRVELLEDAPRGSLTSVVVDDRRRLWIGTDEAFGCVDPSFFHGRTIESGAGPYHVVGHGPQGIEVASARGLRRYRPDVGAAPRLEDVRLDGRALEREEHLAIDLGETIPLEAVGSGTGELVGRYRVDLHHVWLSMENGVDLEIEPGEHLLEVVLADRDLRLSEPFPLRLTVAYPFYYGKGFVLGSGALAAVLVLGLFLVLGRRRSQPLGRALVSTVLTLVLALQVIAGLVPHGRGWPFIGYSMYAKSLDVGHVSYNGVLVGLTAKGRPRRLPTGILGVAADNRWQVLGPLLRGGEEVNRAAIDTINARRPKEPIRRLQIWAERTLVTEDGPVPIAQMILSDHALPDEEQE